MVKIHVSLFKLKITVTEISYKASYCVNIEKQRQDQKN